VRGRSSLSLSELGSRETRRRGLARAGACIISDCKPVAPQCEWLESDDPGASAAGGRAASSGPGSRDALSPSLLKAASEP
jgi:hypothetical protein